MSYHVENMCSPVSGNEVANQFIIVHTTKKSYKEIFQSYSSVIAVRSNGKVTLDRDRWDYSVTTGRYRNQFLGESIKETREKIEAGIYKLANLNKGGF